MTSCILKRSGIGSRQMLISFKYLTNKTCLKAYLNLFFINKDNYNWIKTQVKASLIDILLFKIFHLKGLSDG